MIATKRAYEPSAPSDGYRVLIDRLWPRGVSKVKAKLDAWEKGIAPSSDLREWREGKQGCERIREIAALRGASHEGEFHAPVAASPTLKCCIATISSSHAVVDMN